MSKQHKYDRVGAKSIYAPPECRGVDPDTISPYDGKEIIMISEMKGKKRKLFVPSRKPLPISILFSKKQYDELKQKAHVVTEAERAAQIAAIQQKKIDIETKSKARTAILEKYKQEQALKPGAVLTEAELDAKKKTFYLLKRAFDLQQEQEDEVKKANQLILASKCLAIRAAQVKEKELIEKELEDEERRLDQMMDEHRRRALDEEDAKKKKEKEKNLKFVNDMKQQIKEKEIEKLQEGERIEEEAKLQNKAMIQQQQDEEEKRMKKLKEQEKMRLDLKRANEDIAKYKQVEKEEERIAELRVQEFMRRKAEREAAREAELMEQKLAKEKEIARLRALQEKHADQQAAQDELNARRIQEEVEKEWRRKEKLAAEKKARDNELLKKARQQQIEDIRRLQAVQIEREKQDFYKIIEVQKKQHQKEKEEKERKWKENMQHRKDILQQVNEKERRRIIERRLKFEEALALKAETEIRLRHINDTLVNKMKKLRENKVPEPVVKDIERQLKLGEA